ncbi:hypothetical protein [Sinorhizobium fredii]|uniref:hypothetical protein n=1 Tax=Rhizobium fredii TaxID=380 RepID=UPI003514D4DD
MSNAHDSLFAGSDLLAADGLGPWPVLMRPDDIINLKSAVHITGRTEKTIRGWCKQFGIGSQACPGAPLEISAPALEMVRRGDIAALELLREGRRDHPRVRRYFDFLGIVP